MDSVSEQKGADIIVNDCARISPGEDVLIVSDFRSSVIAERLTAAANAARANTAVIQFEANEYDGQEPPGPVAAAMKNVDVVLLACYRSISHSSAAKEAMEHNARLVSMTKFHRDQLIEGGLYADYEAMQPKCERMAQLFTDADEARVTSPQGTDLTVGLTGSTGNSHSGIVDTPGELTGLTHIEANTSPAAGATNGIAVFDGAIPNLDIGVLHEDVIMEIEDGKVVAVDGGRAAEKIATVWEEHDHPAVYNIAQLAVGMNPKSKYFNDWFSNNHGRYGNVHLGIGTSTNLGGTVRAPVHFDAMMSEPSLELDGTTVLEDKVFYLD